MNTLLVELEQWGCQIKDGLDRMMNDEAFYIHLLKKFTSDDSIVTLNKAMDASDYDTAFEMIHKLKGTASTLGLAPLYESATLLTQDLQQRPPAKEASQHLHHFMELYKKYSSIILG